MVAAGRPINRLGRWAGVDLQARLLYGRHGTHLLEEAQHVELGAFLDDLAVGQVRRSA